jgi:bla regulator protein blaR1
MTTNSLFGWVSFALGLGNHLWQSTLFGFAVALLAFALKKNHARIRYWLWLAASMKFLVPFSLLMIFGSHLTWLPHPDLQREGQTSTASYFVMRAIGRPFTVEEVAPVRRTLDLERPDQGEMSLSAQGASSSLGGIPLVPVVLATVWLLGSVVVLGRWILRSRRIRAALCNAPPMVEGREFVALRKMEHISGLRREIEMRLLPVSLEPGIFGLVRPVLLWPQGISQRLDDAQLEAVLAHEVWHVRRRDNLTAAMHMIVEAIFWFHPGVWWLETRLVEERERACDEEVLGLCVQRAIYAQSILKVCEFCSESSLLCISGITGADLKGRVRSIMTQRLPSLGLGIKVALAAFGTLSIAGPILLGGFYTPLRAQIVSNRVGGNPLRAAGDKIELAQAPDSSDNPSHLLFGQLLQTTGIRPSFEVATIKPSKVGGNSYATMDFGPNTFDAKNATVKDLIQLAYRIRSDDQVAGLSGWMLSARYDVSAKASDADVEAMQKQHAHPQVDQFCLMLQSLLSDRFGMKVTHTTKTAPIYALVVAKGGAKMKPDEEGTDNADSSGLSHRGLIGIRNNGRGKLTGTGATMTLLAKILSWQPELGSTQYWGGGRLVVDETELAGAYSWTLQWSPDFSNPKSQAGISEALPDSGAPSLFTALQEELGLNLVPTKGSVEVLLLNHIDRPSDN